MFKINDNVFIDKKNISFQFIRSSGPGGQNVNKVSTAVELRFDLENEDLLSPYIKNKLFLIEKNRISKEGILVISSDNHRTQLKNKQEAIKRLFEIIKKAAVKPKFRKKTKPTRSSKESRLAIKKKSSLNKKIRGKKSLFD